MSWYVYLLSCADGSLYTGVARDPEARLRAHNAGSGAAYTRSRRPVQLAYLEPAEDHPAALRRELEVKSWSRGRKLALVETRSCVKRNAPLLSLPGFRAPHGFSTRLGGVSEGAYASLNVGANTADDPARIRRNREIFGEWFATEGNSLCLLDQVHGQRVVVARRGRTVEADAQVSDDPSLLLVVSTADCLPLLFHDARTGAVGAAHCGWRGTSSGLAARTVAAMTDHFGCLPADLSVGIGPGICRECYQVGCEVRERFVEAGFPDSVATRDSEGRWRLDLVQANLHRLLEAGVCKERVLLSGVCTSCERQRFFSHRRDRGVTGRHWSAVRATRPSSA